MEKFLEKYATEKRTLDVGSGGSKYGQFFPNRITVDIDKSRQPDIIADAHSLPFKDGEFEIILCTEVLEHVKNPFKVEEELHRLMSQDEEQVCVAVTAIADARKGERLIVFHLPSDKTPVEMCRKLAETGIPSIFIPSPDSFRQVDEIPVLGSGKLDLKRLRAMAEAEFGDKPPAA